MSSVTENQSRIFYIYRLLMELTDEEHYLTTAQIMRLLKERWGIDAHRTTVTRDIETLIAFGADVVVTHSTQNRYRLVTRIFQIPELKLLIDAVESSKFITAKKSRELTDKLASLASRYTSEELKRFNNPEGRIRGSNESVYYIADGIHEAIQKHRKIRFQYFYYDIHKKKQLRHGGEWYVFSPYAMVWNGDFYYVLGYSDKHGGIASFRVDRIAHQPELLDEKAEPRPKDFNLDRYLQTHFRMMNTEVETVTLRCHVSTMDAVIDRFGERVRTEVIDEEWFDVEADVATGQTFYNWVFGFSGKVRILSPENVRGVYLEKLEQARAAAEPE